jgi:putative ABC transport system permease protein
VTAEPDRIGDAFTLGPRLFLSPEGLERAGLERLGSRIVRRTLVKLDRGAADDLAATLRAALPPEQGFRVETHLEAQPALREGIRRAERFLGLAALVSLLVGGVGVAQTLRAWLAGRMDAVAVLRCLGFRPREVVGVYLGQAAALGLVGSVVGAALGTLVVAFVPRGLEGIVPVVDMPAFQPWALARGLCLGVGVSLLFAIGPLLETGRIPPLRVLRRDVEPSPPRAWQQLALGAALAIGVFATAAIQSASLARGALFTLGLAAAAAVLALLARLGTYLVSRFPVTAGRPWVRNALRALVRPGAATMSAVTALGLGVLFVVAVALVERTLTDELTTTIPPDSPTSFLIDIQPDQWEGVREVLTDGGATAIDSVPVVTGRLAAIDGRPVRELADDAERRRDRWALTREQRLTYAQRLPRGNEIVAGELWASDGVDEISVEEEFARDLEVGLGSTLTFDIQGTELELVVSSIRSVDWRTFGINFFLLAEPEALAGAPQVRLAAARLPEGREQTLQDALAAQFPNVTLIRTREMLEKVGRVLAAMAEGVKFLGGFTVLAGIVILAGAVSASAVRRGPEIALLKTFGSTRGQIVKQFLLEHALLGLVAGGAGAVGGAVLAQTVVTRGFELDFHWRPWFLLAALVVTAALTAATGVAAGWTALSRRPMEVLRGHNT